MNGPARTYDWPSLMVDEWTATRDTTGLLRKGGLRTAADLG